MLFRSICLTITAALAFAVPAQASDVREAYSPGVCAYSEIPCGIATITNPDKSAEKTPSADEKTPVAVRQPSSQPERSTIPAVDQPHEAASPGLPMTGLETILVALAGAVLLATGISLRRLTRAER